jgi:carboxyl-terminal processing protease
MSFIAWSVYIVLLSTLCSVGVGQSEGPLVQASHLIYRGEFDQAKSLLDQENSESLPVDDVKTLQGVITQYQQIVAERKASRQQAYVEQWEKLKKLERGEPIDINEPVTAAITDANDSNEPEDELLKALALVAKASEFADKDQRRTLLAYPYVHSLIRQSIERAVKYESEGKWLDAYSECYAWLKAIDPNNQGYDTYADELWDKVVIDSSFEDSPCETSTQRFEGIQPQIFKRVIQTLDYWYVNNKIDYGEMAVESLDRCKLLAEVVSLRSIDPNDTVEYNRPPLSQVNAWNVALDSMLDEIKQNRTGLTRRRFLKLFDRVLAVNETTIELPEAIVIAQFSEAALASLDPHTTIIWPRQVQDFNKAMTNEFTGVGIEISKQKGLLTVASLLLDTPAYKAGLDAGDVIEAVDGVPTKDMSLHCAVKKITGPKGTQVTLSVRRAATGKLKEFVITRDRIVVPTVRGWLRSENGDWSYFIDPNQSTGYVRLTSFSGETARDFEEVLTNLERKGLKGLILDLRGNSGGLLSSAVDIVDMFIENGLIVKTQPGPGQTPEFKFAKHKGTHPDYPLVVLVDDISASASEIVSGALADEKYERAVVVGQRTHGKGSVQVIVSDPEYESALKYTMAYYHLPSNQRVMSREAVEKEGRKDWGITPDVSLSLRSDELKTLWDIQRDNAVLVQADHDKDDEAFKKHSAEEILKADRQLAVAMLVMETKYIENKAQNARYVMEGQAH